MRPRLAGQDGDGVLQVRVALVARRMEGGADDFAPVISRPPLAAVVEGDLRPALGLDHALEVGR